MRVFNRGRFSMGVLFIVLGAVFPFTYYPMDTPFAAWVAAGVLVALGYRGSYFEPFPSLFPLGGNQQDRRAQSAGSVQDLWRSVALDPLGLSGADSTGRV